jgi:D-glycero-alpha-D-manno-heptose 1-phosphate guanylyltransferase
MATTAVILAGGFGTRLKSLVHDRPKPLSEICGRPFLEYQINFLKKQGISDIVLCTGYLGEQIQNYFLNGEKLGINITYSNEEEPLGTGGAIKNTIDVIQNDFLLLNGDSLSLLKIDLLLDFHYSHNSDLTMALSMSNSQNRYGNITINNDNKIIDFTEKGSNTGYINAGIYVIKKNSVNWNNFPRQFSLELDLFPTMLKEKNMYGFISNDYFIDIGIPEDFKKFETHILTNYRNIVKYIGTS